MNATSHIPDSVTQAFRLSTAAFAIELVDVLFRLRWFILAAFVLILADLWFGLRVAKMNREIIRKSAAGRRTLNKFIDYILYIVVGTTISMALANSWNFDPIYVASAILLLCYSFEMDSIYGHICELHKVRKKLSMFKVIWLIITLQFKQLRELDFSKAEENIKNK